ncbi:MAG: alpha/beta hydrolase [Alphaproteobacteria bacterium]
MNQYIETPHGPLHVNVVTDRTNDACVFFIPGFHATFNFPTHRAVEQWAADQGVNFVSLEYTAHDLIGRGDHHTVRQYGFDRYLDDARFVFEQFCDPSVVGPTTLVGHSIGGWNALILNEEMSERDPGVIAGVVSIVPTLSLTGPNGYMTQLINKNPDKFAEQGFVASPLGAPTEMIYTKAILTSSDALDLNGRYADDARTTWVPHPPKENWRGAPIVIVDGDNDHASPKVDFETYLSRLPTGAGRIDTLLEVPNRRYVQGSTDRAERFPTIKADHGLCKDHHLERILAHAETFVRQSQAEAPGLMARRSALLEARA